MAEDHLSNPPTLSFSGIQHTLELEKDIIGIDEIKAEKIATETQGIPNYLSKSAISLRCRVMPPPCIKNPYLKDASETDIDPLCNQRSKCEGTVCLQSI